VRRKGQEKKKNRNPRATSPMGLPFPDLSRRQNQGINPETLAEQVQLGVKAAMGMKRREFESRKNRAARLWKGLGFSKPEPKKEDKDSEKYRDRVSVKTSRKHFLTRIEPEHIRRGKKLGGKKSSRLQMIRQIQSRNLSRRIFNCP